MDVRWPWKSSADHHDDRQPSFILFYLAIAVSGFGVAALFGYFAGLAASNGIWLHTAAHSAVTISGFAVTGTLLWQRITDGRK